MCSDNANRSKNGWDAVAQDLCLDTRWIGEEMGWKGCRGEGRGEGKQLVFM